MSKMKRYGCVWGPMEEKDKGEYIRYSDIEPLIEWAKAMPILENYYATGISQGDIITALDAYIADKER